MEAQELESFLKFYEEITALITAAVKTAIKNQPQQTFQSSSIDELAKALSLAQGEYLELRFNRRNPVSLNDYVDIEAIHKATRPALKSNGLSVTQLPLSVEDGTVLVTKLLHSSGQYIECRSRIALVSGETKMFVSQLNEYKKQHLMAMLGIAAYRDPYDDDCLRETEAKRLEQAEGSSLLYNYGSTPEEEYIRINKTELDQLDYMLADAGMRDVYDSILHDLRLTCLADMPKGQFKKVIARIQEISTARKKLK